MNADLANNFGNLAQRSLSMVAKNCEGRVPVPGAFTAEDNAILEQAGALLQVARAAFDKQEFSRALEAIWGVLGDTNAYFAEQAPWVLRKTDVERMNTVLYVTLEVLRIVAILAQPVMPKATAALLQTLGQPEGEARQFAAIATPIVAGTPLPAPSPVFPKYEEPAEAK
jgi:methionyl-tRNA synthetase